MRLNVRTNMLARTTVLVCLISVSGCAERVPEPVRNSQGTPHISWNIHGGDADSNQKELCQSDPRTECNLPASREGAKSLATVHVFFHPAANDTKYTGTIAVGFFDERHEITPNATVKRGGAPVGQSVTDIVTTKPGTYRLHMSIVATNVATGQASKIEDDITVIVR